MHWERSAPNQGRTTEAARSGDMSWKIESFSGCDPSCYYMASAWKLAEDLDLNRPIRFSVWAKAPAGHGDLHIQLKYEAGGESHYPGKARYNGSGAWQRHEVRLDLRQITGLKQVWAAVRHRGTTGAPAYIDDLQLVTDGPVATTYDVEVATDAGFTNVIQAWTDVNALAAAERQVTAEGLNRTTTYHWRVRGTNAGGTGSWTRGVFTTTDRAARRYYVKDHLGSTRAVVDPDAAGSENEQLCWSRTRWWRRATTTRLACACPGGPSRRAPQRWRTTPGMSWTSRRGCTTPGRGTT